MMEKFAEEDLLSPLKSVENSQTLQVPRAREVVFRSSRGMMPAEMFSGLMSSNNELLVFTAEAETDDAVAVEVSVVFQYCEPTAHQVSLSRCQMHISGL